MKAILTILFCAIVVSACNKGVDTKDSKTLTETDYSISYPKTWELKKQGGNRTGYILFQSGQNNLIQISVESLTKDTNLDAYMESVIRLVNEKYPNNFVQKEKETLKGIAFYKVTFFATRNDTAYKFEEHYGLKNNKVYVISFTTKADDFDKNIVNVKPIIDSFEIK